ncbi:hypothetical protein GCM10020254_49100 [Streptomyces goshikiensis]
MYVVLDDVGFGAMSCYGGPIETPNIDRIAANGLRYSQWHTTALCSPTRSALLTGRNHTTNGMACISEAAIGFPGANGHIPSECATLAEILVEKGYSTALTGKWHLCPEGEMNLASTKRNWPTGRGFERFYGFLGAETSQWYPDLVHDQHPVEQPAPPEAGYHFGVDITDRAIQYIDDVKAIAPRAARLPLLRARLRARPAPGAAGVDRTLPGPVRRRVRGDARGDPGAPEGARARPREHRAPPVNPIGTPDTRTGPGGLPFPPLDFTRPWADLGADEQRLFARMAEVYAGFLSHCDDQIGRIVDYLEDIGQLDNTIFVVVSDNGASGEGGPNGSVNENKFFNNVADDLAENLAMLDELGGVETYGHYPNGWAMAFNTPFKMWKRYSFNGGTCDPCVISWPAGIAARGEVRDQYHHAVDIVPTVLDCLGLELPATVKGYPQTPLQGLSMRYSFDSASLPSAKTTQFYSMLGTRGIWHQGWKAVTTHPAISGWSDFHKDTWELYHTDTDRAELTDLAGQEPERLQQLIGLWFYEAGVNQAFPLDDRSALEILSTPGPSSPRPATGTCTGRAAPRSPSPSRSTSATALTPSAPSSTCPAPARPECCSRTAAASAGTRCTSRTGG